MGQMEIIDLATFNIPARIEQLEHDIDHFWNSVAGAVILLMQLGFAFLEGGCVKYKNMQSIMIKVFTNTAIAITMTWLVGYAFMFGEPNSTNFFGTSLFATSGFEEHPEHYSHLVFQAAIAAAANSIVSGGAAERMTFVGYMLLSVVFSAWIYPVVIHWAFVGWLFDMGYHDFAGSGSIHLTSAVGALVVTMMLKPRDGRFIPEREHEFEPCNTSYIALATITLFFCWMCFNGGSTLKLHGDAIYVLGTSLVSTMVAGASGALTVFVIHYYRFRGTNQRYSLVMLCNGNLAGLIAVTGANDNIEAWAAFIIGILGAIVFVLVHKLLECLKIDDPVDAISLHGGCGLLGAQFSGIFNKDKGIIYGFGAQQWGVQLLGCVCFIAWSAAWHLIFLYLLKCLGILRIDEQTEKIGIDNTIGGGRAFIYEPISSYEQHPSRIGMETQQKIELSQK